MPSTRPSTAVWTQAANALGCDVAAVKAVFEVEAAGRFYEASGKLPRRFEPHHFPSQYRSTIGFTVAKGQAAWRASLALATSARRRMFDIAFGIDSEAAHDASSYGAPQIMGFNAELAGHTSATAMVHAFEQSADNQILAFVAFIQNAGLASHIRSHNWLALAAGYNGDGQAAVYAARIESAYRRQSGGVASATVLRVGSRGEAVEELQIALLAVGQDVTVDGHYGAETFKAVSAFQAQNGLVVDGLAGAVTQRTLSEKGAPAIAAPVAETSKTENDLRLDNIVEKGAAVVGSGGAVTLITNLSENSQTIIVGGTIAGAIVLAAIWLIKKK